MIHRFFMRLLLVALAVSLPLMAQAMPVSVGAGQIVPDPNGSPGPLVLESCSSIVIGQPLISFTLVGVPDFWLTAGPPAASLFLILDFGPSTAPGTIIQGGEFFLPFIMPLTVLGPSPVTGSWPLSTGTFCAAPPQVPLTRNGQFYLLGLSNVPLALYGRFTMQGVMVDPTTNTFITSNAINF